MDIQNNNEGKIPEALQGAFILVFGYHALILSQPISSLGKGIFHWHYIMIAFIVFINLFNIAANWFSAQQIAKKEIDYRFNHLFWDLIILAIFFIFADVMKEGELNINFYATIIGVQYTLLHILYIIWNNIEKKNQFNEQEQNKDILSVLKRANIFNIITLPVTVFLFISGMYNFCEFIIFIAFIIWIIIWGCVIIIYIKEEGLI